MASPNMAEITASIERSLKNCSLNHQQSNSGGGVEAQGSDAPENYSSVELNSEVSLPYHWEQCLDLKTGEIYFINWLTGMKSKEDPRTTAEHGGYYYCSEDDSGTYDSEGSSSESSSSSTSSSRPYKNQEDNSTRDDDNNSANNNEDVLVVAGCKICLMYYMVPKEQEICPKCCRQLVHFDRSEDGSP